MGTECWWMASSPVTSAGSAVSSAAEEGPWGLTAVTARLQSQLPSYPGSLVT